ncbi:hypothetical protein WJX84_007148 [Apatococcus fuscideae]|uniref:RING-type E3 ubiquitin transferase n=1 Tax=Apatococcus fuscideae TaxID=2026836 RepID=A0AAW1SVJ5_9CHLO
MAKPSSEYVWLPHTQVWAKAPEAKRISKQPRSKKRPKTSAAPVPPPLPSSPKIDPTETPAEENGTLERSAAPLQPLEPEGLQACPICLSEIQEQVAKAVILPCMHVFCLGCLSQWIALKRSCPMCKRRVQGYLYGIESESSFKECTIPRSPSPPRSPPRRHGHPSQHALQGPHASSSRHHSAVTRGPGTAFIDEPRRGNRGAADNQEASRWSQTTSLRPYMCGRGAHAHSSRPGQWGRDHPPQPGTSPLPPPPPLLSHH